MNFFASYTPCKKSIKDHKKTVFISYERPFQIVITWQGIIEPSDVTYLNRVRTRLKLDMNTGFYIRVS